MHCRLIEEARHLSIHTNIIFQFSLFCIGAVIVIIILQYRRYKKEIHGELGGPVFSKATTGIIFILLWVIYLVLNALDAYCVIQSYNFL